MLAPRNAADSIRSPAGPGAYAASVVAARAATCRAVATAGNARTAGKSRLARTALDHRRKLAQPTAAVGPTIRSGLTRRRTLGRRDAQDAVQRERQGDGAGRVEPPADEAAGPHHHHGAAGLAHVSPEQDPEQRGRPTGLGRPPLVPLAQTVAVEPQGAARRPAGGVADRAAPRAHLIHRRRPRQPGLDVERYLYESNVAPVAC
jgi:hypothetical protein